MNKTITNDRSLVPFPVIAAASSGDVTAMDIVLKHYSGYISALATRTLYDESGNPHLCIDEDMRRRLETKLITKILQFNGSVNQIDGACPFPRS